MLGNISWFADFGPRRAESLQLEVVKASSGGKTVQIADQFSDGSEIDQSFLEEIDSAIFKFKDGSGSSPDVNIASGQGFAAPYLPPGEGGEFVTPKKKVARDLTRDIEVRQHHVLPNNSSQAHSASQTRRQQRILAPTRMPPAVNGIGAAR